MKKLAVIGAVMFAAGLAAACGGHPKSGLVKGTKDVPPPPDLSKLKPDKPEDAPKRVVSQDAKADFGSALDFYNKQEAAGWNESSCRQAADQFAAVAREHKDVPEAQYMVGRSYQNCPKLDHEAEDAYKDTIKIKANYGAALSNLGDLYYQAGKTDGAKQYWESAIKANPKLSAAYVNLAMLQLEELRKTKEGDAWKTLEADTRKKLSISLAIDNENVRAYTLYGLVYMEGYKKNRNRLDLAKLLLEEGEKRNPKYAPLQHAMGLLLLAKNDLTGALQRFQAATALDDDFAEAHQNVGLITLGTRRYDVAKDEFSKVLKLQDNKNYDALIGLGIAQRGLNDLDGAEATYKKAQALDGSRGEAFYNLGVLYKDFRASKEDDLSKAQAATRTAKDYFQQFLSKNGSQDDKDEASQNIKDCDKYIKQIDDFKKAMANQPPPPPAPSADAGSGSGSGGAGSAAGGSGSGSN